MKRTQYPEIVTVKIPAHLVREVKRHATKFYRGNMDDACLRLLVRGLLDIEHYERWEKSRIPPAEGVAGMPPASASLYNQIVALDFNRLRAQFPLLMASPQQPPTPPKPKKGFWHKVKSALKTVASTVVNIGMSGKGGDE